MRSFLSLQSKHLYYWGWGKGIKLMGAKIHLYVSVCGGYFKFETQVIYSSVVLVSNVYNNIIIIYKKISSYLQIIINAKVVRLI